MLSPPNDVLSIDILRSMIVAHKQVCRCGCRAPRCPCKAAYLCGRVPEVGCWDILQRCSILKKGRVSLGKAFIHSGAILGALSQKLIHSGAILGSLSQTRHHPGSPQTVMHADASRCDGTILHHTHCITFCIIRIAEHCGSSAAVVKL
jgi:hypothetical protein